MSNATQQFGKQELALDQYSLIRKTHFRKTVIGVSNQAISQMSFKIQISGFDQDVMNEGERSTIDEFNGEFDA